MGASLCFVAQDVFQAGRWVRDKFVGCCAGQYSKPDADAGSETLVEAPCL
jgi:hypothetical protein